MTYRMKDRVLADLPTTVILGGVEYRADDRAALDAVDTATPAELREARRRVAAILDAILFSPSEVVL